MPNFIFGMENFINVKIIQIIMYRDRKGNYHKKPKNIISKKRESAYGIFIENQKILLVKPTWIDCWEFPGGGVELGENLIEALKREFLEETGYEIIELNQTPTYNINTKFYADDLNVFFDSELFFFMIKKIGKQNKNFIQNNEIKDIKMVKISDLNEKNINDIQFKILNAIINSNK